MARYSVTDPAKADIAKILKHSRSEFGAKARDRYRDLIIAAIEQAAKEPLGPLSHDEAHMRPGLRSLHFDRAKRGATEAVKRPAHVIYCLLSASGIAVIRVLHDRMEPSLHIR